MGAEYAGTHAGGRARSRLSCVSSRRRSAHGVSGGQCAELNGRADLPEGDPSGADAREEGPRIPVWESHGESHGGMCERTCAATQV